MKAGNRTQPATPQNQHTNVNTHVDYILHHAGAYFPFVLDPPSNLPFILVSLRLLTALLADREPRPCDVGQQGQDPPSPKRTCRGASSQRSLGPAKA